MKSRTISGCALDLRLEVSFFAARAKVARPSRTDARPRSSSRPTTAATASRRWSNTRETRFWPAAVSPKMVDRRSDADCARSRYPLASSRRQILVALDACTFNSLATAPGVVEPFRKINTSTRSCGPVTSCSTAMTERATTSRSASAATRVASSNSSQSFRDVDSTAHSMEPMIALAQSFDPGGHP